MCLVTPTIHFSPSVWCLARLGRGKKAAVRILLLEIPIGQTAPNPELFTKNRLKNLNRIILPSGCLFLLGASPWPRAVNRVHVSLGLDQGCHEGLRGVGPLCPGVWFSASEADVLAGAAQAHRSPRATGGARQRGSSAAAESTINPPCSSLLGAAGTRCSSRMAMLWTWGR